MHLKPDWSPETLQISGIHAISASTGERWCSEIGGFRPEFDGSQDYDLILRLVERTDRIAHIPQVLYHWRAHTRSTAGGDDAKPFAYGAARRAIAAHLERTGRPAEVQFGPFAGLYRVVHEVDRSLRAALVLALTADGVRGEVDGVIAQAARSWLAQPHPAWEVVLAGPAADAAGGRGLAAGRRGRALPNRDRRD